MDLTSKDSPWHYAFSYPALPFSQDNLPKSEDKIQTIAYGCTLKSKKELHYDFIHRLPQDLIRND